MYSNSGQGGGSGGGGGRDMGGYSGSRHVPAHKMVYDGKRMRKAITRRTVDFNSSIIRALQASNPIERDSRGLRRTLIQPNPASVVNLLTPVSAVDDPVNSVTTKFVHGSLNKIRCPINVVRWTPEGRRLLTASAHDTAIRAMTWSHNGNFLVSGDHGGILKIWQPSLNNLKILPGHKESVRSITFSPSDGKFASCSDDGLIKIWDFADAVEERTLSGHGWDVRSIQWHPFKSLLASGSKDNLIKLWDPKSGSSLATIHGHKSTIADLKWNKNGNWLASAGKDQVIKIFDIRMMKEFQTFKGHSKDINTISWHPIHESLLASASGDGSILFWLSDSEKSVGGIAGAHEHIIWSIDWHPVGHLLVSGSADCSVRFWTRHRPGDSLLDQYILGKEAAAAMGIKETQGSVSVAGEDEDDDQQFVIPGMGVGGNQSSDSTPRTQRQTRYSSGPSHHYGGGQQSRGNRHFDPRQQMPPPPPPPPSRPNY